MSDQLPIQWNMLIYTSFRLYKKTPLYKQCQSLPFPKTQFFKPPFFSSPKPPNLISFFNKSPISFQPMHPKPLIPFSSSDFLQPIEELPPNLQEIVNLFQSVQEPKAKYQQLLFYAKNLAPLDPQFKTPQNKVKGCVSQVWIRAYLNSNNNKYVIFEADSDSVLTKGLAALLVQGLSGLTVEEIITVSPDFVALLGLHQSLTPSRNNGFLNMLKLMQKKALQLYVEAERGGGENPVEDSSSGSNVEVGESSEVSVDYSGSNSDGGGEEGGLGRRGKRIEEILERELTPIELRVEDISYLHAGLEGVRGSEDGETHFNVEVVSKEFEGKSLVKRHRLIYDLLKDELQSGLQALSIVAKAPAEVESR